MSRILAWLGVATLIVLARTPDVRAANDPLKPFVVLAFDTSGSMATATGSGSPSCGGADTRLNHARCAISKIVQSYGDMVFGFGRFRTVMGGTTTAATFPTGCCVAGPDVGANGACADGVSCCLLYTSDAADERSSVDL